MRCSLELGVSVMVVCLTTVCVSARAQTSPLSSVGRTPTPEEISAWDIAVGPSGKDLPPGSGTATQGEPIFAVKCAMCHGADMKGATFRMPNNLQRTAPNLLNTGKRGIANYKPFATTIYDFINRAMPRGLEGTLKPDEVYATTALILYKNGIIREDFVIDAKTLPEVRMPGRKLFLPARLEDIADLQKRGCHQGQCPEIKSREPMRDMPWPPAQER